MSKNVTPLPINPYRSIKRKLGVRYVPCEVSGRYLVFPQTSAKVDSGKDFICVDVMTMSTDNQPRKLCELVLNRRDLVAALAACRSE